MDLPRLILAEERRPGKVPSGVLLAAALKQRGYRLRLFVAGGDEGTLRLAECLCCQRCSYLDPVLCGTLGVQVVVDPPLLELEAQLPGGPEALAGPVDCQHKVHGNTPDKEM